MFAFLELSDLALVLSAQGESLYSKTCNFGVCQIILIR